MTNKNLLIYFRENVSKLIYHHKKLVSYRSKKTETQKLHENSFLALEKELFDIGHPKLYEIIEKDRIRSKDAKECDILFYEDQKTARTMVIDKIDKIYQKVYSNREFRKRKAKEFEQMEESTTKNSKLKQFSSNSNCINGNQELFLLENFDNDKQSMIIEKQSTNIKRNKVTVTVDIDELIKKTSIFCGRFGISVGVQTGLLALFLRSGNINLNEVKLSKTKVEKIRKDLYLSESELIKEKIKEKCKNSNLILHIDTKKVTALNENYISEVNERLAIVVTSPDWDLNTNGKQQDELLGIVECQSGKGYDQALACFNVIKKFGIESFIIGICADTIACNTGCNKGCISILGELLNRPLLRLLCRKHSQERHILHAINAITKTESKGPSKSIYTRFKAAWPMNYENVQKNMDQLSKFPWCKVSGTPLEDMAKKSLSFCKKALELHTFPRNDYKHLCQYVIVFLEGREAVPGFIIHKPAAEHEARFMADALYILAMKLTQPIIKFLTLEEEIVFSKAAIYVASVYAKNFLQSSQIASAAHNDLCTVKEMIKMKDFDADVPQAFISSYLRHSHYLSEETVVFCLFDKSLDNKVKEKVAQQLLKTNLPEVFKLKKFKPVEINENSELNDYVGQNSWLIFKIVPYLSKWLESPPDLWTHDSDYKNMQRFIKRLVCVNDCCERAIKLVKDFIDSTIKEEKLQDILLVLKEHRVNFPFYKCNWSKEILNKL